MCQQLLLLFWIAWVMLALPARASDDTGTFMAWVATLSSAEMEGRGPGTAGIKRARDWIVGRMTELQLLPAFGERFVQPFEVKLGVRAVRQQLSAGDRNAEPEIDFTVMGFSGDGAFAGPSAFVGYAVTDIERGYDSFAGMDLSGKVAVAFRYEPMDDQGRSRWAKRAAWSDAANLRTKAARVAERGAVALLVVNPPGRDEANQLRPTATTDFPGERGDIPVMHVSSQWLALVLRQGGIDDPAAFLRESQRRADRGEDRPVALDQCLLSGESAVERPVVTLHNVAGMIPGRGDLADEWVILGAHYDHLGFGGSGSLAKTHVIHPGADDNASGTAGALLLAQRLMAPDSAEDNQPRRSILFILFSGEERGLLGSMHFTRHMHTMQLSAENVTAMLNLDMIGRLRDDKLHVFGVDTGQGLRELVKDAARRHRLKLTTSGTGLGMSDHSAFYFKRIPGLHFFTGIHEDYHRPSDTADKITPDSVRIIDMVEAVTRDLATRREQLAFQEVPEAVHGGMGFADHGVAAGGPRAFLGIMPDYATLEGDSGCGVGGVTPDSPAARAGLESGDIITAWNDKPITNVRDLTAALTAAQPGDIIQLVVTRDRQVRRLPVTLGAR